MAFEEDSYYTDKFTGKNVQLQPEGDLLTLVFEPGAAADIKGELAKRGWEPRFLGESSFHSFAVASGANYADLAALLAAGLVGVAGWTPVYKDQDGGLHYILPGQLDLQFVEGTDSVRALSLIESMGSQTVGEVRTPGYYSVTVPPGQGLFTAVRAFSSLPEIEFAVPSLLGYGPSEEFTVKVECSAGPHSPSSPRTDAAAAREEPCFGNLWAFKNDGQQVFMTRGTKGVDIRMLEAWKITLGSPEIVIAVVDSGMDLEHPDLSPNLLPRGKESWNFVPGGGGGPDPIDDQDGHGTGLCGIAAAALNGEGVVGVAPRCSLMPLKVALNGQLKTRADAIYYVAERAIRDRQHRYVINLSWVMSCDYTGVRRAVSKAIRAGALVIAGVDQSRLGEEGKDMDEKPPTFPASYQEVIAVTATDQDDHKGFIVDFGRRVDLCAPGANLCTTGKGGTYCFRSGNSFATAMVSGLAALVWSLDKNRTNIEIGKLLEGSCDQIDPKNPGLEGKLGAGRINAFAAIQAALRLGGEETQSSARRRTTSTMPA